MLDEPVNSFAKPRQSFQYAVVDHCDREQWNDADHRADFQRNRIAIFVKVVVVKPVFFVPESVRTHRIHRVGDFYVVFKKLAGHICVSRIFGRQLQSNRQHRGTEKSHPGAAIRLMQVSAGGQRF